MAADTPTVVMMCGLPASGKTTTAGRLHARLGGILVRSCDVYRALGISLPGWVRRTHGFTVDVAAYDRVRNQAYTEMARRLDQALGAKPAAVIVDAVHGERDKREAVYGICHAHGTTPALLLCRCDDPVEVRRRFQARDGREHEPPYEASDWSVFQDISRRWCDPAGDRLPDGRPPTIITYDTLTGRVGVSAVAGAPCLRQVLAPLEEAMDERQTMIRPKSDLPDEIELCRNCQAALIFHLPGGTTRRPYCAKCGAREPGALYVRKDLASIP